MGNGLSKVWNCSLGFPVQSFYHLTTPSANKKTTRGLREKKNVVVKQHVNFLFFVFFLNTRQYHEKDGGKLCGGGEVIESSW